MRSKKNYLRSVIGRILISIPVMLILAANTPAQKNRPIANAGPAVSEQPLYSEYKGVRIGMAPAEVRAKLGTPTYTDNELDYFTVSATETVQVGYDAAHKVTVISVDYQNGAGAPEPRAVLGADLESRANGTLYKAVRYEKSGLWVSYSRTVGSAVIVSITLQKI